MGGPMIYVISSWGIQHVMCTFFFECAILQSDSEIWKEISLVVEITPDGLM
jgi:hypothetical protein